MKLSIYRKKNASPINVRLENCHMTANLTKLGQMTTQMAKKGKADSQMEKNQVEKNQHSDVQEESCKSETTDKSTSPDNTKGQSNELAVPSTTEDKERSSFPIVGMGASAGGLEAFELFFANMPSDSGMAFVLAPHLDPTHKSMMVDLLKRCTEMEVLEVGDGMEVQVNHLYVIPPNKDMVIMNGTLQLMELTEPCGLRLPIDFFLRSLAADQGEKAICIILSGTGTSGTLGLKAIKGEGGMVMVQTPESAKYDGMPRSAINTGLADYVLPAEEMPQQLINYVRHSYIRDEKEQDSTDKKTDSLQNIFTLLRSQTGHDFSLYKPNTIKRRIERRMVLRQIKSLPDYVHYLQQNAHEVGMLFKELLIGVTNFFRDPKAFEVLKKEALPHLLENKPPDSPVRIWVPGCSTGEEAYSIAIILREYMDEAGRDFRVQIFATDIDDSAIEIARAGVYPESIAADVSKERLMRSFTKEGNTYKIRTEIREMIVFALQDIIKDPPFSKLDLISCRNLLIYFSAELQKKVLPLFHYILNPNGILFLGSSESVGEFTDFFSVLNNKWKFFTRKELAPSAQVVVEFPTASLINDITETQSDGTIQKGRDVSVSRLANKILVDNYAPPCVLINEKYDLLYVHGRVGQYLEIAEGEARLNLLEMAREDLKSKLRSAIHEALSKKADVVHKGLRVKNNSGFQIVNLTVKPIKSPESMRGLMMVAFEEAPSPQHLESDETTPDAPEGVDQRVAELEQELNDTKENLQTTIEELETANEELKSANEELQSTNEELQSTNEELETSKEELQSLNEELTTVNTELQTKIEELSDANNDMKNLLSSTQIATIFVDKALCIKRFTPEATEVINLIETDVGRPIGHIVSNLIYEGLVEDAKRTLETLTYNEQEVQSKDGRWYIMRIMPYQTTDNVIDGVVITFVDINERKQAEQAVIEAQQFAESIIDTVRIPLVVLDANLRVISANRFFYQTFKVIPDETEGQGIYALGDKQWDIPKLREFLEEIIPENTSFEDFEVDHEFPSIGRQVMLLNARRMYKESEASQMILLAIEDVTARLQAEKELKQHRDSLESIVEERTTELTKTNEQLRLEIDERKRAEEEIRVSQKQLRALASELSLAEERERRRVATELHDDIVQPLVLSSLRLGELGELASDTGFAEKVDEIRAFIEQTIERTRSLTVQLSPPLLDELGLGVAVEWLIEQLREQTGVPFDFEENGPLEPIDDEIRIILFRAVRELLVNVVKHAKASNTKVSIRRDGDNIRISVEDDGVGFDTSRLSPNLEGTGGFGLFSLYEQLNYLGGDIEIKSKPGCGTQVTFVAPMRKNNHVE